MTNCLCLYLTGENFNEILCENNTKDQVSVAKRRGVLVMSLETFYIFLSTLTYLRAFLDPLMTPPPPLHHVFCLCLLPEPSKTDHFRLHTPAPLKKWCHLLTPNKHHLLIYLPPYLLLIPTPFLRIVIVI